MSGAEVATGGAAGARQAARANVAIAALGHFLNDLYGNIYPTLVPLLMGPLHMTVAMAAWVTSANGLTAALLQPVWGYLADRRGGLRVLPFALLVGAAAVGLLGLAPSYAALLALVFIAAAGNSAFHPPAAALVHDSSGEARGLWMSAFMVAGNIGRALGPTAAALAAMIAAQRSVGLVALPGILVALWIAGAIGRAYNGREAEGDGHTGHGAQGADARTLARALSERGVAALFLLLMSASRSIVTTAVIAYLPIRYKLSGGPVLQSAAFIGVMLLAGSLGNGLGGALSDRVPRTAVVAVASVASALFLALFISARGPLALVLLALAGFTAMSVSSVVIVMGQELFPDHVATASGLVLGWGNAVASLGAGLLAFVAQTAGIDAALYASAAIAALGTPLALLFPAVRRRSLGRAGAPA
ncbi:MAG: MFS transporter [Bacillota bacterium]|nr:MFS transporter [Bacillota bacterium]